MQNFKYSLLSFLLFIPLSLTAETFFYFQYEENIYIVAQEEQAHFLKKLSSKTYLYSIIKNHNAALIPRNSKSPIVDILEHYNSLSNNTDFRDEIELFVDTELAFEKNIKERIEASSPLFLVNYLQNTNTEISFALNGNRKKIEFKRETQTPFCLDSFRL